MSSRRYYISFSSSSDQYEKDLHFIMSRPKVEAAEGWKRANIFRFWLAYTELAATRLQDSSHVNKIRTK